MLVSFKQEATLDHPTTGGKRPPRFVDDDLGMGLYKELRPRPVKDRRGDFRWPS